MSISPDEKWLVFLDADSGSQSPVSYHLVTMDLATHHKTHHRLRKLPSELSFSGGRTPWQAVAFGFEPAGWWDGTYYLRCQMCYGKWGENPWIAFTPGVEEAAVVDRPMATLQCSDGLPNDSLRHIIEDRGMRAGGRYEWFSVPVRNGRASSNLYTSIQHGDGEQFIRIDEHGERSVIVEHERSFKEAHLSCLRVSPDERYLAYAIIERPKMPIPWPGFEIIFVFDIEKQQTIRVKDVFDTVVDLAWSADSERFYFSAFNSSTRGVYRVEMNAKR